MFGSIILILILFKHFPKSQVELCLCHPLLTSISSPPPGGRTAGLCALKYHLMGLKVIPSTSGLCLGMALEGSVRAAPGLCTASVGHTSIVGPGGTSQGPGAA